MGNEYETSYKITGFFISYRLRNEFKNDNVQLFPNPNSGIFTIQSNDEILIESIIVNSITNNRLIKIIKPQATSVKVDLYKEDSGIYIAEIKFRDGTTINKKIEWF